ncbi:MAG TPA: DsbE family thiol:disulfide interchange protein [Gammaproteobacteria bacterium]
MWRRALPIIVFLILLAVLGYGLTRDPSLVSSPLIGKPLPEFSLPLLNEPQNTIGIRDLRGTVYLLNVWASWCEACRVEHPLLMQLAAQRVLPIYGLNYRDQRENALRWLERFGNPYEMVAFDERGDVGIDLGVYGAPETYLVDRNGIVVYKHIGPITPKIWEKILHPRIVELQAHKE